ncbi:hypothetical protein CLOM_g10339 [Closterium sp. NIES-68]|nr:hypothetical protein CLOM_g10339 [Closterium sp. NIES-68]GJP80623.1 hypothetical protein CLOP_g10824 [Closterium sp. NIES-67]
MAAVLTSPSALPEPSPADLCALRRQLAGNETAAALLERVRARGEARGSVRTGFGAVDGHRGVAEGGSGGVAEVVGGSGSGKTEVLMRLAAAHLLPLPARPSHPPAAPARTGGARVGAAAAAAGNGAHKWAVAGAVVVYADLDLRFHMPRFTAVLHARATQCVHDTTGSSAQPCQQQQRVEGLVQAALHRFHLMPCRNTCHWLACLKSLSSLLPSWQAQHQVPICGEGSSGAGLDEEMGEVARDGNGSGQVERVEGGGVGEASGLQGEEGVSAGDAAMRNGGAECGGEGAQWVQRSWFSPEAGARHHGTPSSRWHCPPLLLIDSIGAFYWLDRAVPPAHAPSDHGGRLLTWVTAAEVAARELHQLSQSHGVAVVAARTAIFGGRTLPPAAMAAAAPDSSNVLVDSAAAPVVPAHVPPREYMPAAWQALVSHRLSLAGPFSPADPLQPSQSQPAPTQEQHPSPQLFSACWMCPSHASRAHLPAQARQGGRVPVCDQREQGAADTPLSGAACTLFHITEAGPCSLPT